MQGAGKMQNTSATIDDSNPQSWSEQQIAAETVVVLTSRIWRITAANPSLMTGPGTNSYLLIGHDSVACVDPGPADEGHCQALLDAVAASGKPLRHILLTHTHKDHSPGTSALVALTGARVYGCPPLAHDPSQDRDTVIDEDWHDGQIWSDLGWPVHVIHTPGHVENHLCFHDPEQGWLITGDHLIQGSTVVIIPPHGRLSDYIRSLRRLLPLQAKALMPGHGRVMANAEEIIEGTIAHRQQREDKTRDKLAGAGLISLEDLVPLVYDDVPPWLHPVARFSLWAHLIKLAEDGQAEQHDNKWQTIR